MKLLLVVGVLIGGYAYLLLHTTDLVMQQATQLSAQYQSAARYTDKLNSSQ